MELTPAIHLLLRDVREEPSSKGPCLVQILAVVLERVRKIWSAGQGCLACPKPPPPPLILHSLCCYSNAVVDGGGAQCESCELSVIGGKMWTIAWETASQIALRSCPKEEGSPYYIF